MGVLGNVGRQVVQDDVLDVGDIQTSSSDRSRDQDRGTTALELLQGPFSFTLGSITVDSGGDDAGVAQEIAEGVGHSLGLDEDEGQSIGFGADDVEQEGSLVVVFDEFDSLLDVFGSGTDSADGEEDVVLQEVTGEGLDLPGESGGEHERLSVLDAGHVLLFNDLSNLRFETHIEHSIGFIENEVLDVGQRDLASVDQIDESTGSSGEQVASSFDRSDLSTNVGTTVDDGGSDPRSVRKLSGFLVDLRDQFSSRREDQRGGVDLSSGRVRVGRGVHRRSGRSGLEQGVQDGEQETTRLSGTGLGTGHQVSVVGDDGDRVLLNGRGGRIVRELDVVEQDGVDGRRRELGQRIGNTGTGGLDGNIGVLVKVDTGRLVDPIVDFTVKFLLHPHVPVTSDMFPVLPRTESIGNSRRTTAETTSRGGTTTGRGIPVCRSSSIRVGEVSCATVESTSSRTRGGSFTDGRGKSGGRASSASHVRGDVSGSTVVHRVVQRHAAW